MRFWQCFSLNLSILMFVTSYACAQGPVPGIPPLLLTDEVNTYQLGTQVELLQDPDGNLTIDDVSRGLASKDFQRYGSEDFNFGVSETVCWLRFRVHNASPDKMHWVLEAENPRLNFVYAYLMHKDGRTLRWRSGNGVPHDEWPVNFRNPSFRFSLSPNDEAVCYMRIENRGASRFTLVLHSDQAFVQHVMYTEIAWGFFYGALVTMTLYNAVLMIALRDRTYFYYFMLIVGFICYQTSMNGTAFQWFWPSSTWWADHSIIFFFGFTFFFGVAFSRNFLELPQYLPRVDKAFIGIMVLCVTFSLGSLGTDIAANLLAHAVAMFGPLLIMVVAGKRWAMGYEPARVIALGWCFLTAGAIATALVSFNLIPQSFSSEYTVPFGFTVALLSFALALADRIRIAEREYQAMLSKTVEERTRELDVVREEVKTLSELLPICSSCKKIRDDKGYWTQLEGFLLQHADLEFSHGICPECAKKLYPDFY